MRKYVQNLDNENKVKVRRVQLLKGISDIEEILWKRSLTDKQYRNYVEKRDKLQTDLDIVNWKILLFIKNRKNGLKE